MEKGLIYFIFVFIYFYILLRGEKWGGRLSEAFLYGEMFYFGAFILESSPGSYLPQ